jgi:tryptophan-rich sensory protein
MKHRVEDMYDQGVPQQKSSWFSNLFGGSRSYQQQPSYTSQMGQYGARKLGKKIAQTFTGYGHPQQHGGMFSGYGQHRGGGMFGYGEEEPSLFEHPLEWIENSVFNRTLGPLVFVAWPLMLGLFISSWSHKQIRNNRAWYDKITLPSNFPSSWLYDPMWTVVLTGMGYASYLVFEEGGFGNWLSLGAYNLSLMMLIAWPLTFFSLHDSVAAPVLASILTGFLGITSILFFFQSGVAGFLMTLATAWVGYMTIVNWQVYSRNAGLSRVGKEKGDWPWSSTATSGVSAAGAAVPVEARDAKKVR